MNKDLKIKSRKRRKSVGYKVQKIEQRINTTAEVNNIESWRKYGSGSEEASVFFNV